MSEGAQKQELWDFLKVSYETNNLVSYETKKERLEHYAARLVEWNEKFNLVAPSTIPQMWARHFLDSAQLWTHLPAKTQRLVDLGSGAGFPGLVLAILGVPEVHLIESTGKKARFLSLIAEELQLNVTVHAARAEGIKGLKADVVTARAVAALRALLSLANPFMTENSMAVFLKGETVQAELTEARKYWTFSCEPKPSLTSASGTVLTISKLKGRPPHASIPRKRKKSGG